MKFHELDTPSLLVDYDIFMNNLMFMQDYADRNHVSLRPHTKTHKSPELAAIQFDLDYLAHNLTWEKPSHPGCHCAQLSKRSS